MRRYLLPIIALAEMLMFFACSEKAADPIVVSECVFIRPDMAGDTSSAQL